MEEDPFPGLKLASYDGLDEVGGRVTCARCGRSRKYFCYSCFIPLPGTEDKIPRIKLPLNVDIIKHKGEVDGKSTSGHAAVVAPDDVTIYTYPELPEYEDKTKVLLVFPGSTSLTMRQYVDKHCDTKAEAETDSTPSQSDVENDRSVVCNAGDSHHQAASCDTKSEQTHSETQQTNTSSTETVCVEQRYETERSSEEEMKANQGKTHHITSDKKRKSEGCDNSCETCEKAKRSRTEGTRSPSLPRKYRCPFNTVLFIDSTWQQTRQIYTDHRLEGIQRIELKSQTTRFWRHQTDKPRTYLATIEAIYYFLREYHEFFVPTPYDGDYDNLLFFFCFLYQKIRKANSGTKELKAYKTS